MKVVQGWPKFWATFGAPIGIFSQSVGLSLAIWASPVQFSSPAGGLQVVVRDDASPAWLLVETAKGEVGWVPRWVARPTCAAVALQCSHCSLWLPPDRRCNRLPR